MQQTFSRHRHELPMLAAFLSVAAIELLVVHFLASRWSRTAAWVLTGATALFLVQIGPLIYGLVKWPTVMGEDGLLVRFGRNRYLVVPYEKIASSEDVSLSPLTRGPHVLRTSIIAHPNVALRLNGPISHRRKKVTAISMRIDEPCRFHQQLRERLVAPIRLPGRPLPCDPTS